MSEDSTKEVKLKHEIVQIEKHQERVDFDREIERSEMYAGMRKMRSQMKHMLQGGNKNTRSKVPEEAKELELRLESFKEKQMQIFEEMAQDEERIRQELELFSAKLHSYEKLSKSAARQKQRQKGQPEDLSASNSAKKLNDVEEFPEEEEEQYLNDSDKNSVESDENVASDGEAAEKDINGTLNTKTENLQKQAQQDIEEGRIGSGDENEETDKSFDRKKVENERAVEELEKDSIKHLHFAELIQKEIEGLEKQMAASKQKLEEVEQNIQANGGKNCGWSAEDHSDFLKLKTKYRGQITKAPFQKEYRSYMAFKPEEDLEAHIQHYIILCELEERKKTLLQEYKDLKARVAEKQSKIQSASEELAREKHKIFQKTVKEEEQKRKREEVKQWKAQRLQVPVSDADVERQEKELAEMVEKKREREKKEKERREQQKRLVMEYKEHKELERARERERGGEGTATGRPPKRQVSADVQERIQQKEELLLKRKQQQILQKKLKQEEEEIKRLQLLETKSNKYQNVESKLQSQTVAAEAHKREKHEFRIERFSDKSNNMAGGAVRFSGRAIPLWRQGTG